ncbi:MAG: protein-L-isoaspartate O-methyltransferase [Alphaproteobacteria bacterium]|nr:protein-L-isoaspartate O-methyltransferase [Alphaproteobacteria bacterium]
MPSYADARRGMVLSQLQPNGVRDERVLEAIGAVPRELFVAAAKRGVAYVDEDLPIAPGRYLMEPLVFGKLLQAADVVPGGLVLDVGCASGYSTAVLARLAGTVVGLEEDAALRRQAEANLRHLDVVNAAIVGGLHRAGYPQQGPYQAIVIEGAVTRVPDALVAQLSEGGRLAAVVRQGAVARLMCVRRAGELVERHDMADCATPLLAGFEPEPEFVF